jgi:DNA (cytosine-5)-methyltransferase 1
MKHLGLFEGIGGFSLAARWAGWETLAWCEINEFCQKILTYHFPKAEQLNDIKKTDFTKYANKIDILTGGFPCQPFSSAGKRKGTEDERHLWPEMLRAIREIKPKWVVGENVYGIVNWNRGMVFQQVQIDLEAEGYEVQSFILPACAVNAPHKRNRIWFIAYAIGQGTQSKQNIRQKISSQKWFNGNGFQWNITNANSYGLNKCNYKNEINTIKRGKYAQCYTYKGIKYGINTNTTSIKCKRWNTQKKSIIPKAYRFEQFYSPTNWKTFPTQSPICGGNDGISYKLDKITFSKWRNESIKAYGNAIVPQVALQIFKTINLYEQQINKI